jgi:hypothetical protein
VVEHAAVLESADGTSRTGEEKSGQFVVLRQLQKGAFSRAQAVEHGITDKVLAGRCRARQIQRLHVGVYADFTGPVPWETRMWAAWLAYGPQAALTGTTALRRFGLDGEWADDQIHLALPHSRRVDPREGIIVSRHCDLAARVQETRQPPTVRLEVALLVVASAEPTAARQAAILLDSCRQRRTTPERLLAELGSLRRLPGRQALRQVLRDAADGVHSFLEQTYLRRVERAHGLPAGSRQVRDAADPSRQPGRVVYRDVEYVPYDLIIELDGQTGHVDAASRWRDMTRDNAATLSGKLTLRFGYQLVSQPCATAAQVAAALRLRGWPGTARPCSPTCQVRNPA